MFLDDEARFASLWKTLSVWFNGFLKVALAPVFFEGHGRSDSGRLFSRLRFALRILNALLKHRDEVNHIGRFPTRLRDGCCLATFMNFFVNHLFEFFMVVVLEHV